MIIYINGCSHTAEYWLKPSISWPAVLKAHLTTSNSNESIRLINDALCGAGNDYIFHNSLENIEKLIRNNEKPDFVIIQWSGPNRRTHCNPDGKTIFVNLYDNVDYHIKLEPMGSMHTLHYIFNMQEYLKNNDISYCFFNYMEFDKSIENSSILDKIDMDRFLTLKNVDNILFTGFLNYIKDNNLNIDEQGHPNRKGHIFLANEILKKMDVPTTKIKSYGGIL